jgi:hypothetical protein
VKINSLAELLSAEQYCQVIDSLSRGEENAMAEKTTP